MLFIVPGVALGTALAFVQRHTGAMASTAMAGSANGDLSCPQGLDSTVTGTCIDNYLKKKNSNSPLIGKGKIIVEAGQKYNINPAFLVAIAGQESSFGTNNGGNPNKENYFNTKCSPKMSGSCVGGYQHFASIEVAIDEHASLLNRVYFSQGLNTIKTIQEKYCPTNDSPLCGQHWIDGVTKIFNEVIGSCPNLSVVINNGFAGTCGTKILNVAKQEIGKTYTSDCTNYSSDGGKSCLPWCAAFASWVYKQAGYLKSVQPGTVALRENTSELTIVNVNNNISNVKPGDIFWMHAGTASGYHVGIIESIANDGIHTIEGNVGKEGNVDRVAKRTKQLNQIITVARPKNCN